MAKPADAGGAGAPFAKFNSLGDTLVGAFASAPRECTRERRSFDDGTKPVMKGDKPQKEEVLYFVAMPGTTAQLGNPDSGYTPIAPGDEIRFAVYGFKWGQVIDQRKALPAYGKIKAGQPASGDVYTITLAGWSAETKNPAAAEKAGFTVVDGRILLRTQDEKNRYVLAQSNSGGNTNPAKDYEISIRRPTPAEAMWEAKADDLFDQRPWAQQTASTGGTTIQADPGPVFDDEEPF